MIRADKKQWKQVIQKHEADLQPLSNYDHIFSTSLSPPQLYTARPRFISEHVSAGQQRSRHESDLASSLSDIDTHEVTKLTSVFKFKSLKINKNIKSLG